MIQSAKPTPPINNDVLDFVENHCPKICLAELPAKLSVYLWLAKEMYSGYKSMWCTAEPGRYIYSTKTIADDRSHPSADNICAVAARVLAAYILVLQYDDRKLVGQYSEHVIFE